MQRFDCSFQKSQWPNTLKGAHSNAKTDVHLQLFNKIENPQKTVHFFICCTIIENILLFYLTRREIQLHLFFARTRVGSSESQCNVANNVKTVTLSPTAPVSCSRFKAEYCVRPLINIHEYTCYKCEKKLKIFGKLNGKKNNLLKGNKMSRKCRVL